MLAPLSPLAVDQQLAAQQHLANQALASQALASQAALDHSLALEHHMATSQLAAASLGFPPDFAVPPVLLPDFDRRRGRSSSRHRHHSRSPSVDQRDRAARDLYASPSVHRRKSVERRQSRERDGTPSRRQSRERSSSRAHSRDRSHRSRSRDPVTGRRYIKFPRHMTAHEGDDAYQKCLRIAGEYENEFNDQLLMLTPSEHEYVQDLPEAVPINETTVRMLIGLVATTNARLGAKKLALERTMAKFGSYMSLIDHTLGAYVKSLGDATNEALRRRGGPAPAARPAPTTPNRPAPGPAPPASPVAKSAAKK
eukprot:gnl/Hemi2/12702_TR4337_c0_g12_i1.p1 gnl/Hemi2/12702_TR4337_c0_g12~~gnl/Hemi2/12702_TR4337_c0_g12_i1.p1  ORF type:complete len:311 (-),score=66.95 gnl/Hemi2/12702_TR4337_c0_g12_i1:31-963(-)